MNRQTVLTLALCAALVPALAGCAASAEPAGPEPVVEVTAGPEPVTEPEAGDAGEPAPESDTCALLSGLDASALLGEPAAAAPAVSGGVCKIEPADGESPASIVAQVVAVGGAGTYSNQKELLGVDAEIPGLGDEAFQSGKRIDVLVGEHHLYIQVVRNPVSGVGQIDDAQLLAAAQTMLANTGW